MAQLVDRQKLSSYLFIIVTGLIWFSLLGYRDLFDPDEGRYAEIAREMLISGDWLTPRLNGLKYFEKPPLQYWGTAISMAIWGTGNAAARVWCSGLGFIGVLWVRFVGNRLFGDNCGDYASLILISTLLYVVLGHGNSLDMGVTVFLAVAVGALLLAQHNRNQPAHVRNWMLLAWAALAGATLSKGLIGLVLPGGAVLLYCLWQRDWGLWRHLHLGKGLLLFLVITAPWFVLVSQANPEFPHFFFIHEHFERYTSDVHNRTKPSWYFLAVLAAGVMPWLFAMLAALIKPGFSWIAESGRFDGTRLLWVYALFIFCFFSISHSKLPAYILPMFPPLAWLAGRRLAHYQSLKADGLVTLCLAVAILVFSWRIGDLAREDKPLELFLSLRPWIITAAVLMAVSAAFMLLWKGKTMTAAMAAACFSLLSLQVALWGTQTLTAIKSSRLMAEALRPYRDRGTPIYSVHRYDQSLPYYLEKEIQLVGFKGEFKFGIDLQPEKWIGSEQFVPYWIASQQAIAILPQAIYDQWRQQKIPMRLIYQDPKHIAVARL